MNISVSCSSCCPAATPIDEASDEGAVDLVPSWDTFFPIFLLWPLSLQFLVIVPLMHLLRQIYKSCCQGNKSCRACLEKFLGSTDVPIPEQPCLLCSFYALQIAFSLATVVLWVIRSTPPHTNSDGVKVMEWVMAVFFLTHYFVTSTRHGFLISNALTKASIIDILTIVPVFFSMDMSFQFIEMPWLSLSFLRAYLALDAYENMENLSILDSVDEFSRTIFRMVLRLVALIVMMGGTVFTLEVLGELETFQDLSVTTDMGDLSFIQMAYWIMTTISTVGYGDFSPQTVLSRIVVSFFIVIGVVFFTVESAKLLELQALLESGKGVYRSGKKHAHVVVVGATVGTYSSMIVKFLDEILHAEHESAGWPDIVLMSENPIDDTLKAHVASNLPLRARKKVIFLVGSALEDKDLDRVQLKFCQFGLVLPDTNAVDVDQEDQACLLRVLSMKRYCSKVRARIMVAHPESKQQAVHVGIRPERVMSANEVKACIFTQSCRIRGFVPFMTNLLRSCTEPPEDAMSDECLKEYFHGVGHEVYGLLIPKDYEGMTFQDVVALAYEKYSLLLVGLQVKGKIMMLPLDHKLVADDVCFAIATGGDHVALFSQVSDTDDWQKVFTKNREKELYSDDYEHSLGHQMMHRANTRQLSQSQDKRLTNELEEVDDLTREQELNQAQLFRSRKGCITIIIASPDPVWQQVKSCLSEMRRDYLPFEQPVIVLTSSPAPRYFAELFSDVALLTGPPHRVDVLLTAGVLDSSALLVMSGEGHGQSDKVQESSTVILASTIEHLIAVKSVKDKPFVLYDFLCDESMLLVPPPIPDTAVNDAMSLSTNRDRQTRELTEEELKQRSDEGAEVTISQHPRYLAGQFFSPDFFGTLLGRMYYLPATIEFVEAIAMPGHMMQSSFAWQTRLPKGFEKKSFLELFMEYIKPKDRPVGAAVALYRQPPLSPEVSYIVTNPLPQTSLRSSDLVVWFAPVEFGTYMHKEGLLLCCESFSPWGPIPCKAGDTTGRNAESEEQQNDAEPAVADAQVKAKEASSDAGEVAELQQKVGKVQDMLQQLQEKMDALPKQLEDSLAEGHTPIGVEAAIPVIPINGSTNITGLGGQWCRGSAEKSEKS